MGIGIVILFWLVVGLILAALGALVFGGAAMLLTRGVRKHRKRVIVAASLIPIASIAWVGAIFAVDGIINETMLHRDFGIGDAWRCPLPNGYSILMIDVTDYGCVYNPKTQRTEDIVGEKEDAPFGVRELQVLDRYILGGRNRGAIQSSGGSPDEVDSYFILDTQTGKRTDFPDYDTFRAAGSLLGITPHLEPISKVYSRYRFTPLDVVAGVLAIAPPFLLLVLFIWWIVHARKSCDVVTSSP